MMGEFLGVQEVELTDVRLLLLQELVLNHGLLQEWMNLVEAWQLRTPVPDLVLVDDGVRLAIE
jgi:hypothetical protein